MTCSCDHHHHHHEGDPYRAEAPLDAADLAENLLRCPGPIPYPHPNPGCPTPPAGLPVNPGPLPSCTTSDGLPGHVDRLTGGCVPNVPTMQTRDWTCWKLTPPGKNPITGETYPGTRRCCGTDMGGSVGCIKVSDF